MPNREQALSLIHICYQIRSLEKELDLALFERSTTRVALTEAGRAFVPQAEGIYRSILNARTALKGFARRRTLTLRLPPVLLQRDPIYPILMARLQDVYKRQVLPSTSTPSIPMAPMLAIFFSTISGAKCFMICLLYTSRCV